MHKYFSFLIFLFAVECSLAQDLTATMKTPEVAAPGTDYIVEITITKGTINSYIKFSQKLPPRFKATEVESSGGSFTFDDSIVKIIWFFPPAKNEFTFSYKVKVPKDAGGNKKIGGKVYYFFNTNREVFNFDKRYITIGNPKDILAAKEKQKNDSIAASIASKKVMELLTSGTVVITKTDTTVSENPSISQASDTLSGTKLPKDTIAASKDTLAAAIAKTTSKTTTIKDTALTPATKPIVKVVAKDTLPARTVKTEALITGIEPEPEDKKESATGEVSYCVQLGAFKEEVPLELANRFFKISARGIKNFKDDNGFTTFTVGNFKTRDEALPLKKEMLEKGFQGAFIIAVPTNKLPPASTASKPMPPTEQLKKPDILTTANTPVITPVTTPTTKMETQPQVETLTEKVAAIPSATVTTTSSSAKRTYRVQIGAFKEEVPLETANKFFKISAKGVKNLKDNRGLTVYTVGDFSNKEDAVILKNEMITKGFKDAFVIAFENGEIVK